MIKPANQIPLNSPVRVRDTATQPFRVVLHQSHNGEWVTHIENVFETFDTRKSGVEEYQSKPIPDFYWGHYFGNDYNAALADYQKRCLKYNL